MLRWHEPHGELADASARGPGPWHRRLMCQLLVMLFTGTAVFAFSAAMVRAQAVRPSASPMGQVTIIVLDMSSSMGGSNGSDPDGLRCSAANAYISLSGPNQFIGVVGLVDPSGSDTAQIWAQPAEMATLPQRQQLIQTIDAKSHHCQANGETPTYDALTKAYAMLASAATGGRAGSVILLTDGVPYPNQQQQANNIIQQLVPKFSRAGWPINTIALGNDPSVRPFLHDVSSGTSGSFDDDVNPATSQPDPLQIAPVFLRYFAASTGRTPKQLVAQQELSGGSVSRDFSISSLVQRLDIVVVKQDSAASVTLTSPEGIHFTTSTSSVLVALDPHYAIFSIDGPTPGDWIVTLAGGSRAFSVYGLVVTNLHITLTQPTGPRTAFPIDQPLVVQAVLTNANVDVNGDYTVTGKLTNGSQVLQQVILKHVSGSATYTGSIGLPPSQAPGTYDLTLFVTQGSGDVLTSSQPRPINFEIFPSPFLVDQHGAQTQAVTTTVTSFDLGMQRLYSLPVLSWFSGLPLAGIPATPSAVVNGVVTLNGRVYQNAVVEGSAVRVGRSGAATASVTSIGAGRFQVVFPAAQDGQYLLTLQASGTYQDSHGAFGTTQREVTLTIVPATNIQEARAWSVTVVYLLIAILLSPFVYRWFLARRRGEWSMGGGARGETGNFYRVIGRRNYRRAWFRPNVITSDELWGYPGLRFMWGHLGRTRLTAHGPDADAWTRPRGQQSIFGTFTYKPDKNTSITVEVRERGSRRRRLGEPRESHDPRGGRLTAEGFGRPSASRASARNTGNPGGFGHSSPRDAQGARAEGRRRVSRAGGTSGRSSGRSSRGSQPDRGFGRR